MKVSLGSKELLARRLKAKMEDGGYKFETNEIGAQSAIVFTERRRAARSPKRWRVVG